MSSAFTIETKYSFNRLHLLFALLLIKAFISLWVLTSTPMGLSPDEAQYWTWSRALDFGYYSKPPGIAWQIWASTLVLGHTELGVRFGAVVLNFFIPLVLFAMARFAELSMRVSFWSAIIFAFCPIGIFLSFTATTDVGMLLFFSLAIATVVKGISDDEGPNYYLTGTWVLLGALYKWPTLLFWPLTGIALLFIPKLRRWSLIYGVLISLIALFPSIYWNLKNDWVTFKHVTETVIAGAKGNPLSFIGAQIGLFHPIFWGLFFWGLPSLRQRALLYITLFPLAIFCYVVLSFFKGLQANWALFLLPPASVIAAWTAHAKLKYGRLWLHLGVWTSIIIATIGIAVPIIQRQGVLTFVKIPYRLNGFQQTLGWRELGGVLSRNGYDPEHHFLVSNSYQGASLLSFYAEGQNRAYFLNLDGRRNNQFSYWPGLETRKGENGYFVVLFKGEQKAAKSYSGYIQEQLESFFTAVKLREIYPIFTVYGEPVKFALVYFCEECSVMVAEHSKKY